MLAKGKYIIQTASATRGVSRVALLAFCSLFYYILNEAHEDGGYLGSGGLALGL